MNYLNEGFGFLKPYRKTKWIKKRSLFVIAIMLVFSFRLFATTFGQTISIHVKDVPLIDVMRTIQNQTGHSYFLNGRELANLKVSAALNNADLKTTMSSLLKGKPASWSMKGKTIVIKKKNSSNSSLENSGNSSSNELSQQQISGKVTDDQGNPLRGVTVKVVGSSAATSTNENGEFQLNVPTEATTLSFSLLGFQVLEVPLNGQNTVNVSLMEGENDLEEVVVVGYGTQLKRDLTGAVSKVDGEALKNMPIRNATEGLQGQTSGVQVTSTGGSPGTPPAVRIRGIGTVNDNNPLYVVDGLPQSDIGWLNPNDIVSMEVLKDASATAIYGSRAANGVIMVTTAKGAQRSNELSNLISFDSYLGFQNPIKTYDMMNAKEFMEYKNLANINAGLNPYSLIKIKLMF
ncbi:TonB-dependent receptor plug domain-containing protein [Sphingobacterium daejeonense]|uniref:TonB-dependent receptor plug domain-containing protein n=1 Tax=Sphingobacterium daejeonense TaxID=371142 RepID=UPI0010C58374|nr:TonB-dependent receptor plug domain-containing protein [Sphingobacterium daejeonense]VTP99868.1 Outer membrane receptor for ferrienterochelin and colicins [Sphingobacterium daejeonense]